MNRLFILLFAICFFASSYGQDAETLRKAEAGDAEKQLLLSAKTSSLACTCMHAHASLEK